jgi:hypothetical protein
MVVIDLQVLKKRTVVVESVGFPAFIPGCSANRASAALHLKEIFETS